MTRAAFALEVMEGLAPETLKKGLGHADHSSLPASIHGLDRMQWGSAIADMLLTRHGKSKKKGP